MHFIILYTAKYLYLLILLVAGIYWLTLPKKQKIQMLVLGATAAILSFLLAKVGSALFYDPRPFVSHNVVPIYPHGADNGFPSDHTLLSACVAFVVYAVNKKVGAVLAVLALFVGIARVAGHIHSPIDIAGSIVFAMLGTVVAYLVTQRMLARLFPVVAEPQ